MNNNFATEIYREKEKLRERIAEETLHFWRKNGVLNVSGDYYKAKESLMKCLEDIGA